MEQLFSCDFLICMCSIQFNQPACSIPAHTVIREHHSAEGMLAACDWLHRDCGPHPKMSLTHLNSRPVFLKLWYVYHQWYARPPLVVREALSKKLKGGIYF